MLCYKSKANYAVCKEFPSGTVGWFVARGTVGFGEFWSPNPDFLSFFPPFSQFLSLVSFFRVRLSVRLNVRLRVRVRIVVPSSRIVRELVLSLTRPSFPLVRCRQ